jgi:hypothetical protein
MEKAFTEEELEALKKAVDILSSVDKSDGDLFDIIGILAADVADVYEAYLNEDNDKLDEQKKDAINTALEIAKKLNNF